MQDVNTAIPANWTVAELTGDSRWVFTLDDAQRAQMIGSVRAAMRPGKPLFDYTRHEFDFSAAMPVLQAAFEEQHSGRGIALIHDLPRDGVSNTEFELLTWAIGLHFGVARPQGKASQYLSEVKDAGTNYRGPTGRGYSSNAQLDFHVDGSDVVLLACYNTAKSGGMSMCTSSVKLHEVMQQECPDSLALLYEPFAYSRQGEEAPDERPFISCPLYSAHQGRLFGRINRNRVVSGQKLPGIAPFTPAIWQALDRVEEILRRPELMYAMWLSPGDLQLVNNHVVLHSRTEFEDFEEPARKRLLYRLWLATPNSYELPPSWVEAYRSTAAGSVRGGFRGVQYGEACRAFEQRQAADLGMRAA